MSMQTSERATLAPYMQGGVLANAEHDERSYRMAVHDSRARGNTAYPGVAMPENTGFYPFEIAYMKAGSSASKMSVRTALNGEGGAASRTAPNNPELQKEAVRASIKLAGVAFQPVTAAQANSLGITLQVAGLTKLRQTGNGAPVLPGDKLMAVVPEPGDAGLRRTVTPGAPVGSRYLLDVQPVKQHGAATRLFEHVTQALADPERYRELMGGPSVPGRTHNADMWTSASKALVDSYLTAGVLQLAELIDAGLVAPSAEFRTQIDAQAASDGAPADATSGQKTAVLLAAWLRLIKNADGSDVAAGGTALAQLRNRLARVSLTAEGDHAHAFAVFNGRPAGKAVPGAGDGAANKEVSELRLTYASESAETGKLRSNLYGALRSEQYNHARRAIGAFHAALLEQDRFVLGFATTGRTKDGEFHAMLQMV